MKNLNKKYSKIEVQKLKNEILIFHNKHKVVFVDNLIGFRNETYYPSDNVFINNLHGYNHLVFSKNNKLQKKYPTAVYKSNYKEWLKKNK